MTTATKTKLDVAVLEQAKGYLETQGWGKGDLVLCGTGEVCALGALDLALGCTIEQRQRDGRPYYKLIFPYGDAPAYDDSSAEWEAWNEAEDAIHQRSAAYERVLNEATQALAVGHARVVALDWNDNPVPIRSVVTWNDNPASTKQDVIDVFDRAIENIKSEDNA